MTEEEGSGVLIGHSNKVELLIIWALTSDYFTFHHVPESVLRLLKCVTNMVWSVGGNKSNLYGWKKKPREKKRPLIILSAPCNEKKYVIIACKDLVIMIPNYI